MTGHRTSGQKFIGVPVDEALLALIDAARSKEPRAEFVRRSIAERLGASGYDVPEHIIKAPDRAGKGGRKKVERAKLSVLAEAPLPPGVRPAVKLKRPAGARQAQPRAA